MTFTLPDPIGTMVTLISGDWDDTNTSTITPSFDRKAKFLRDRTVRQVLFYTRTANMEDVGRGEFMDWEDLITIEVRLKDTTSDALYNLCVQEVLRIIGENRIGRSGGYDYIRYGPIRDESHRGQHWYRKLIDVYMNRYSMAKASLTIDEGDSEASMGAIYDEGDAT